jgi:hypothetical protein
MMVQPFDIGGSRNWLARDRASHLPISRSRRVHLLNKRAKIDQLRARGQGNVSF